MPDEHDDLGAPGASDDLDGVRTPLTRLAHHGRRWIAAVVAVAMLVPAGIWVVDEIRFRLSAETVVATIEGELSNAAVTETILLVRTAGCEPGTTGSGSAFVVDAGVGAALITNRHVVEDARQVSVRALDDSAPVRVTDVRVSDAADVAVLEVADPAAMPPALAVRRGSLTTGESVRLVGFPAAMPFTTEGTVAEVSRTRLLLDLRVDRGASGSPVVDDDGHVVGQVFAVTADGLGMATPIDHLVTALRDTRPVDPC